MRDLYIRRMSLPEPLPGESYLNRLPVVRHLAESGIDFHKQVTFFVGENGSGKSTLIEALAVSQGFNPEGGTKNFRFSTEKMSDSGTLFDINKLNDVSKDVLARKSAEEIYDFMLGWAKEFDQEKYALIAENREYVAFVEVKSRKDARFAEAREFVNEAKQRRIAATAALWLAQNQTKKQPRFDVVEIYGTDGEIRSINHIENAFEVAL